jgi:hypothetical protein
MLSPPVGERERVGKIGGIKKGETSLKPVIRVGRGGYYKSRHEPIRFPFLENRKNKGLAPILGETPSHKILQ